MNKRKRIKFLEDPIPYEIVAEDKRYMICIRKLNKRQDAQMLWNQVGVNAYLNFTEAWEHQKDDPVYTLVDTVE